jgi:hypothetical protein
METNSILLIDSNAVLTFPIPSQTLQPIPGWDTQLRKVLYTVQLIQLPAAAANTAVMIAARRNPGFMRMPH